jgi:hypothetical protein
MPRSVAPEIGDTFMMASLRSLPARLLGQVSLLRRDPERFGRNMLQFTNPALFEQRLIDVMNPRPMHVTVAPGAKPHLNILNPALTPEGMTGGPNTIINLALRIAENTDAARGIGQALIGEDKKATAA